MEKYNLIFVLDYQIFIEDGGGKVYRWLRARGIKMVFKKIV